MAITVEQMHKDIRNWEMEAGESFVDYFESDLNEANFLFWCLGKGYITQEQFHAWEESDSSVFVSDIVFGDEDYSVVKESGKDFDEVYEKAIRILSEFLVSTKTYQKRVKEFFEENPI